MTVFRWINPGFSRAKLRAARKRFTLTFPQMLAASLGLFSYLFFGPGYLSGGVAMISAITLMILFNTVHPRAVFVSRNPAAGAPASGHAAPHQRSGEQQGAAAFALWGVQHAKSMTVSPERIYGPAILTGSWKIRRMTLSNANEQV